MTADSPAKEQDKFVLRLPDGMRDRIAVEAKINKRSMNAEIVARLEASFGNEFEGLPGNFREISWEMVRAMEEIAQRYAPALMAAKAAEEEQRSQKKP